MAMTERNRRKSVQAAQKLLPGVNITGYAVGRAGSNPTLVVLAMLGTLVVVVGGLMALTGTLILPGAIPVLLVQHALSPPRGVVVTDQGVALARRSVWTGRPAGIVSTMAHGYVQPTETSMGRVKVMVGHEPVWLPTREEAILRRAMTLQHQQAPGTYPPGYQQAPSYPTPGATWPPR